MTHNSYEKSQRKNIRIDFFVLSGYGKYVCCAGTPGYIFSDAGVSEHVARKKCIPVSHLF